MPGDGCTRLVRIPQFGARMAIPILAIVGCASPAVPSTGPTVASGAATVAASAGIASPSVGAASPSVTAGPGPSIRPDELRGTIAFAYDDGLWLSNADGTNRRQLSHDGGFDPTLSPDGRQIAYRLLQAADDGEIWVMDATGAKRRNLVNDPDFSDWGPAWSPDGSAIAFDSNRQVGLAVWLMRADGTDQRILTRGHGEYPSWSPDGTRLAYAGGSYYDIWVVNADGSDDHAITSTPAYDMGPAWSPDGAWIAYHTQVDAWPAVGESGMGDEMEDAFPAWSPDGRFLMWARHGELVVARPDGSWMIDIGPCNFPSWVP